MMPQPMRESFGTVLRCCRRMAGWTQEALALRARVSARAISDLERGIKQTPQRGTLQQLLDALDAVPLASDDRAALMAAAARGSPRTVQRSGKVHPAPRDAVADIPAAPMVGRTEAIAAIQRLLAGSGPPLLLFGGEPGIGKSRLLHEAHCLAQQQGWLVLHDGCQRRSGQQPYVPIVSVVAKYIETAAPAMLRRVIQACPALWRLLPELVTMGLHTPPTWALPPEQERRLLFETVIHFHSIIRSDAGVLLILDDLQWAGADALDLLTALARAAGGRIRIVGAYRTSEAPPDAPLAQMIADLAHEGLIDHMLVPPLAHNDVLVLLHQLLPERGEVQAATIDHIVRQSEGVPFFLVSYVESQRQVHSAHLTLPLTLVATLRQRILACPADAQAVLFLVAVAGRAVALRVVLVVLQRRGWHAERIHRALEDLVQADLLRTTAIGDCQITHDLIREVALQTMAASRKADLHGQLANALAAFPTTSAAILAYHFMRALTPEADAHAIHYLWLAARQAHASYAFADAASYYQELVQRLEAQHNVTEAIAAREHWGAVLALLGNYAQAIAVLNEAAAHCMMLHDRAKGARIAAALGRVYRINGDLHAGTQMLETLLASVAIQAVPAMEYAHCAEVLADLYFRQTRYAEMLATVEAALARAADITDMLLVHRLSVLQGTALGYLGRKKESIVILEHVIPQIEASSDRWHLYQALSNTSQMIGLLGELGQMERYCTRWVEVARSLHNPELLSESLFLRGLNLFHLGAWQEARDFFEQGRAAMAHDARAWISAHLIVGLGLVSVAEGKGAEGSAYCQEAIVRSQHGASNPLALLWGQWVLAEQDLVNGRYQEAHDRLVALWHIGSPLDFMSVNIVPMLAWALIELKQVEVAQQIVTQALNFTQEKGTSLAFIDTLRIQTLLYHRLHLPEKAVLVLHEAISAEHPFPYYRAKIFYLYGQVCVSLNDAVMAQRHLGISLAILQRLGEHLYAPLVQRALAATQHSPK